MNSDPNSDHKSTETLASLRETIDQLDRQLLDLLNQRVEKAGQIGHIKEQNNAPIYVPPREEALLQKLSESNHGPLSQASLRCIFREIISASIAQEKALKVAYLGPAATFTHQAALKNFGSHPTHEPLDTIQDIFHAVDAGDVDYGVIPIENSSEGGVFHSMDMLVDSELSIVAEVYLRIEHCLISGSSLENIKEVYSKDQALGQCREWLHRYLPRAEWTPCASTAREIDRAADPEKGIAIIASELAAKIHDVPILKQGIQDKQDNSTRFLVIGKMPNHDKVGHDQDKTSLLFTINDEPSALHHALEPFGRRNINMTRIESRPSRRKAWDYVFFIDIVGHWEEPTIQEAIAELKTRCPLVKWLGSYPRAR